MPPGGPVFRLPDERTPWEAGVIAGSGHAGRPSALRGNPHRLDGPVDLARWRRAGRDAPTRLEGSPPRD